LTMPKGLHHLEQTVLGWLPNSWQVRLRRAHAGHKNVVRGMVWLTLFVMAAKGVAAIKEVAVAYRFGTGETLEGYLLAFNLATWPVSLLFSVMHFVLVPALVRQQAAPDGGHAWQRQVTTWVWVAALTVGGLVAALLPLLIRSGWLGLAPLAREAALAAVPWLAPVAVLGVLASWHACQLMSRQRHANTLLEAMPAVGILFAVLLIPSAAVDTLLWGTLAGFVAQWILVMTSVHTRGQPVIPSATTTWPLDRTLGQNAGWLLAAQLVLGAGSLIEQIILAYLPPGSLSTFNYANRVMALVFALTSTVFGRSFLPILSGFANAKDSLSFAKKWSTISLCVGFTFSCVIALSSTMMIGSLFERGAFTANDTAKTSQLLALMSFQLPLYVLHVLLWQWCAIFSRSGHYIVLTALTALTLKYLSTVLIIYAFDFEAESVVIGEYFRLITICIMLTVSLKHAPQTKELNKHQEKGNCYESR
jgi:putative peptidoglycan lipid II flippase